MNYFLVFGLALISTVSAEYLYLEDYFVPCGSPTPPYQVVHQGLIVPGECFNYTLGSLERSGIFNCTSIGESVIYEGFGCEGSLQSSQPDEEGCQNLNSQGFSFGSFTSKFFCTDEYLTVQNGKYWAFDGFGSTNCSGVTEASYDPDILFTYYYECTGTYALAGCVGDHFYYADFCDEFCETDISYEDIGPADTCYNDAGSEFWIAYCGPYRLTCPRNHYPVGDAMEVALVQYYGSTVQVTGSGCQNIGAYTVEGTEAWVNIDCAGDTIARDGPTIFFPNQTSCEAASNGNLSKALQVLCREEEFTCVELPANVYTVEVAEVTQCSTGLTSRVNDGCSVFESLTTSQDLGGQINCSTSTFSGLQVTSSCPLSDSLPFPECTTDDFAISCVGANDVAFIVDFSVYPNSSCDTPIASSFARADNEVYYATDAAVRFECREAGVGYIPFGIRAPYASTAAAATLIDVSSCTLVGDVYVSATCIQLLAAVPPPPPPPVAATPPPPPPPVAATPPPPPPEGAVPPPPPATQNAQGQTASPAGEDDGKDGSVDVGTGGIVGIVLASLCFCVPILVVAAMFVRSPQGKEDADDSTVDESEDAFVESEAFTESEDVFV